MLDNSVQNLATHSSVHEGAQAGRHPNNEQSQAPTQNYSSQFSILTGSPGDLYLH